MVAFIVALLITAAMIAPIFPYAKKRPVGTPLTWGEAMLGGTYVFFIIFWIYGVVPHQWLTLADAELGWRPDLIWFGPGGAATLPFVGWTIKTPWFPVMINARAVRDIVAVLLYVGFLGGQMWIWGWWQNRGKRADVTKAIEPVSTYGRPLVNQA